MRCFKAWLAALQSIFLRIQSTSSERESADAETDSSGSETTSESAASVSDFDAYLGSLHSTAAAEASATASAKSDLTAFAETFVDVEQGFSTHFPPWTTMPIQITLWTPADNKKLQRHKNQFTHCI